MYIGVKFKVTDHNMCIEILYYHSWGVLDYLELSPIFSKLLPNRMLCDSRLKHGWTIFEALKS